MSDLISRKDAIEELEYMSANYSAPGKREWHPHIREAQDVIRLMPSAEPERKNEHWTGDCCSCCGVSKYNYIKMVDDECGPFGTWNFCPHCGADMRGNNGKA